MRAERRARETAGAASARPSPEFAEQLEAYRALTMRRLGERIPAGGPRYLYELAGVYPSRSGKGLRAAICLATCGALGGDVHRALDMAAAIELFHNGFLIHDDIQDYSEQRRGGPTLHAEFGTPIALNVGNATNLLALQQLARNRERLGSRVAWLLFEETQAMLRLSLEGQAMELGWIRDNACELVERDYLEMCLKKTSWYSFIYPMRVGAIIARNGAIDPSAYCRFGWYLGAAFQVRDDLLNLIGDFGNYGKEIGGDLFEGKRTLSLIHVLSAATPFERRRLEKLLARPRAQRSARDVAWLHALMQRHGSIAHAQRAARQLAGAALSEGLSSFDEVEDGDEKRFLLETLLYVVNRDR